MRFRSRGKVLMKFRGFLRDLHILVTDIMYFAPSILGHHDSTLTFMVMNMLLVNFPNLNPIYALPK